MNIELKTVMATMSLSPLMLQAGTEEVPDWSQQQMGTKYRRWIQEYME